MARAAKGRSSIYKGADGKWHGQVSCGTDSLTGKRVRKHVSGRTKKEVSDKVKGIEDARQQEAIALSTRNLTVEVWLNHWLSAVVAPNQRPSTFDRKEWAVKRWIVPAIGDKPLTKITPELLERTWLRLNRGGEPATPSTKAETLRVFKVALELAAQRGHIVSNPAATVKLSGGNEALEEEVEPFSAEEMHRILAVAPDKARIFIGLLLGLRQGEVLGLQWRDIDLDSGTLFVRRQWARRSYEHGCIEAASCKASASKCPQRIARPRIRPPKTGASRRALALSPVLVAALKVHRMQQARQKLESSSWNDAGWVFTDNSGNPIEHDVDRRRFNKTCRTAGVAPRGLHALRHTTATWALLEGAPDRATQDLMGWASPRMAARYQHYVDEAKRMIAAQLESRFVG